MAISLLQRFIAQCDAIGGFTLAGMANGAMLTRGFGYSRPVGGHNLYYGVDIADAIDYAHPVGAVSARSATPATIRNFPTYPLPINSVLWFDIKAISPGGVESEAIGIPQRIETDANGDPLDPTPNPPIRLRIEQRAEAKLLLSWEQDARGEQAQTSYSNVYGDAGTGTVDTVTPIGVTSARVFLFTGSNGQAYKFLVRNVSFAEVEEKNVNYVTATADSDGPADIGVATVEYGVES